MAEFLYSLCLLERHENPLEFQQRNPFGADEDLVRSAFDRYCDHLEQLFFDWALHEHTGFDQESLIAGCRDYTLAGCFVPPFRVCVEAWLYQPQPTDDLVDRLRGSASHWAAFRDFLCNPAWRSVDPADVVADSDLARSAVAGLEALLTSAMCAVRPAGANVWDLASLEDHLQVARGCWPCDSQGQGLPCTRNSLQSGKGRDWVLDTEHLACSWLELLLGKLARMLPSQDVGQQPRAVGLGSRAAPSRELLSYIGEGESSDNDDHGLDTTSRSQYDQPIDDDDDFLS